MGQTAEFEIAQRELFKLTNGLLGLSTDHLVVIPGNHDVVWSNSSSYDPDQLVSAAPPEATRPYRDFFKAMFLFDASADLGMARRLVFPGGQVIDIVALNSSSLEQGKDFLAGMGRTQEHAYDVAANALGWRQNRGASLRIVALHHHVVLTENNESPSGYSKGFGIAVDAPRILRRVAKDGVHLVLHGHKHRAFVWRSGCYELPERTETLWNLGYVNILGGGSAGSSDTDGGNNYFHLLRVRNGMLDVEMYRSQRGGSFTLFSSWSAELSTSNGGLTIKEWEPSDASAD